MDLAIGVAVGSSMQIALLVLPLMVMLSWFGVGSEAMTLDFDGFQVAVLFIAVLLVNYLIQDGESHWLEGVLLMATYLIIAVSAWFYRKFPYQNRVCFFTNLFSCFRRSSWLSLVLFYLTIPCFSAFLALQDAQCN